MSRSRILSSLLCVLALGAMALLAISPAHAVALSQPCYTSGGGVCIPVEPTTPLPVTASGSSPLTTTPVPVTPTDKGGTITLGGTAQTLAAANTSRKSLVVQNPCTATGQGIATAEDLFISVTGSATVNSSGNFADIPPCGSATISWNGTVITAAVSVNATTTSHRWYATESQ